MVFIIYIIILHEPKYMAFCRIKQNAVIGSTGHYMELKCWLASRHRAYQQSAACHGVSGHAIGRALNDVLNSLVSRLKDGWIAM